ncbi:hypothetical protein FKP32DRAFT_1614744 [Trametes sanguinea]|nr:hypothetical protein FKP32DRAFT_1614744 [Trametes sanguinea]
MNTCPPEVQLLIFSFACTDDGSTGRSLSLVSRTFQRLSYEFQWHSLAILGHSQAVAFARMLYSQQPIPDVPQRPIHHLFISTRPVALAYDHLPLDVPPTWIGVLRGILRHAAPTLKTLAVVCLEAPMDSAAILSPTLRLYYPCLTELTIRGRCTLKQLSQPNRRRTSKVEATTIITWPSIPTLRRLHLACAFQGLGNGTHSEHILINELAPSLTHLRLSVLDLWGSKRIAEILHAECADLGVADPFLEVLPSPPRLSSSSHPPSSTTARRASGARPTSIPTLRFPRLTFPIAGRSRLELRPPTPRKASRVTWHRIIPNNGLLQLFAFQSAPTELVDFYCSCCMDVRGDGDVMRVFEALARSSDERFLYIPCHKKSGYDFSDAQTDWLERINSCSGCWAERRGNEGHEAAVEADGSSRRQ